MTNLLTAIGVVVGLMALGAGLVAWPLGLIIKGLKRDIEDLKRTRDGAAGILETERLLDDARDLSPDDELGVLFGDDPADGDGSPGEPQS